MGRRSFLTDTRIRAYASVVGFGHGQDLELRKVILEPAFVGATVPGPADPVPKLPEDDDRDGHTSLNRQPRADGRFTVDERRERIGIENHLRSSGSTISNS